MTQKKNNGKHSGSAQKKGGPIKLLIAVVLLVAAFAVFWNQFTLIRVIEVSGASAEDAARIAERSGVTTDMHLSDVDPDQIERALGSLGQWEYLGYETEGYSTLRLLVRTRSERAVVHYAGSSLVLDEYGQVMENRKDDPEYSLLEIKGLEIQSASVGRELGTTDKNQILSVSEVILALDETGAYSRIRELNASDLDNLYVITVTGVQVDLGDSTDMANKCRWMIGVLDSLEQEGRYGGVVDVSTGKSAVYKPQ